MNHTRKKLPLTVLVVLCGLLWATVRPSKGAALPTSAPIVVTDADAVRTAGTTRSTALDSQVNALPPRFTFEFLNRIAFYSLQQIPAALDTQLGALAPRIGFEFVNKTRPIGLQDPPAALDTQLEALPARTVYQFVNKINILPLAGAAVLQTQLGNVADRVIVEQVNRMRKRPLTFPGGPACDDTSPMIANVTVLNVTGSAATLRWATDEFSTAKVDFGAQVGVYPQTVLGARIADVHQLAVTGAPGSAVYYRITSTDLCGNARSLEGSLTLQTVPTAIQLVQTSADRFATNPLAVIVVLLLVGTGWLGYRGCISRRTNLIL